MMVLRAIYHFLGSITFAIILIALVALFVIFGTIIESLTESHRYAANFTYHNPLFIALLGGFFINILISALRRWPFAFRHIPFLITHLGLLMIISGALIKTIAGLQGTMGILEGSGSEDVFIPDTYVIHVEKKSTDLNRLIADNYNLPRTWLGQLHSYVSRSEILPEIKLQLVSYAPHSNEQLETWIKKDFGYINGLNPFPVYDWDELPVLNDLPVSSQVLFPKSEKYWNIIAGRTETLEDYIQKNYLQDLQILVTQNATGIPIFEGLLKDLLGKPVSVELGTISCNLQLGFTTISGFLDPRLYVQLATNHEKEEIVINLDGHDSLINTKTNPSFHQNPSINIDLQRTPTLAFIQDKNDEDIFLMFLDPFGRIQGEFFRSNKLNSYVSYDRGFAGYTVQTHLTTTSSNRRDLESSFINQLSTEEKNACLWIDALINQLEPSLRENQDLLLLLRQRNWPLIGQLEKFKKGSGPCTPEQTDQLLTALAQQIFSIAKLLPNDSLITADNPNMHHRVLSGYSRAFDFRISNLDVDMDKENIESSITLECPLTFRQTEAIPQKKLEANTPLITLKATKGEDVEWIKLNYDPIGQGFKKPIFHGEYLISFQPSIIKIPFHIRLRQARQINYPDSMQPYSYESDLLITDRLDNTSLEKTISMNHVHETWDGYRFYLANISPPNESAAKKVQVAVNYDPAKYWLTYPGAIILTLGILLLFWLRPYKSKG